VHNISCKALNSVNCNKLVNAHWYKIEPSYYNINIRFDLTGFESNIMQILNYIQSLNIKIPQINTVMEKNKIYLDVQFKTKLTSTICFVNSNLKPKK
jgi:(p)ppGpp synthase/HD superfamily hydrolase